MLGNFQLAIDGPASAGKSTVAKLVASSLGYIYVDTGAMYRAVTLLAHQEGLDYGDEAGIVKRLNSSTITFSPDEAQQQVFLNEQNVTEAIRSPEITNNVSQVSALPAVRTELVARQRELANAENVVMDGRDIGTTVLPHADLKIFLIASASERAKRRYAENIEKGIMTPLATLQAEIEARDQKDSTRKVSPLKQAIDAKLLDSTHLTITETADSIKNMVKIKQN